MTFTGPANVRQRNWSALKGRYVVSKELSPESVRLTERRPAGFGLQNPNAMRLYKLCTLILFVSAWQAVDLLNSEFKFYNALLFPSPLALARRAAALLSNRTLPNPIL